MEAGFPKRSLPQLSKDQRTDLHYLFGGARWSGGAGDGWLGWAANAGALAVHYPVNFISATLPLGRGYRARTGGAFLTDQQRQLPQQQPPPVAVPLGPTAKMMNGNSSNIV